MRPSLRLALLFLGAAILFTVAVLVLVRSDAQQQRSPEFMAQVRTAVDAIDRYGQASGLSTGLALLEAKREVDALRRMARNPREGNASAVVGTYLFAVQMQRINPSKKNTEQFRKALADVTAVEF